MSSPCDSKIELVEALRERKNRLDERERHRKQRLREMVLAGCGFEAIAQRLGTTRTNAVRWVREARARGDLPPARQAPVPRD